jgi:hypothetical protein
LAFAKLDAGFADEAIELCNRGLKADEPNPRLLDALAKCRRAQEDESTKESGLLDSTKVRREVFRAMGRASLLPTPVRLHSTWQGPLCKLVATVDHSSVVMTGTYERKGFLGGLLSGLYTDGKTETATVEYLGRLYGEVFVGKVKTSTPSSLTGVSFLGGEGIDCVGYLDSTGTELVILEGKNRYVLSALGG